MSRKLESSPQTPLADDLIWGIRGRSGIAATLGIKPSQAYYLVASGKIPTRKIGHRTVVASRAVLRRYLSGDVPRNDPEEAA